MSINVIDRTKSPTGPLPLPFCGFPRAKDVAYHGLQLLPESLPLVDFERARPHRSNRYTPTPAVELSPTQQLEMARIIARSFAKRDALTRHLQPPKFPPAALMEQTHTDPYGCEPFGEWTQDNITYWSIRLFELTDPASPRNAIRLNMKVLEPSMALVNQAGEVLGGVLNEPYPSIAEPFSYRQDDPFIDAVLSFVKPIFDFLDAQGAEAVPALCAKYPAFEDAYAQGKVGRPFMAARDDATPSEEAFEQMAATAERYQQLGYEYQLIEATHQWPASAWETLGAVRVHFAPFRTVQRVPIHAETHENGVSTPDGFIADRDTGSMFYVLRLQ